MKHYDIYYDIFAVNHGFTQRDIIKTEQIGSKQAWVHTTKDGRKWLQSYYTIVSYADANGNVTHFGKYSSTTSRHQSTFAKMVK